MTQTTIQIKEPKAPATDAQIKFLTGLLAERECPAVAERYAFAKGFLTKGAASELISEAKAAPKKPYQTSQPKSLADWAAEKQAQAKIDQQVAEHDAALAAAKTLTECPEFGYYELDGTVYYWDVTGKDLYPQLRKLTKVTSYTGAVKGSWKKLYSAYGSPKVKATFTPYNGKGYNPDEVTKTITVPKILADAVLAGAKPMTMEQAAQKGKLLTFCIRCGAALTDPISVANGIGPVCITYWH